MSELTPAALLTDLTARGFDLSERDGVLLVVPGSALTDEDRQAIRQHKPALLDLLAYYEEVIIPIGTTSPVRQTAEADDRRTVEQELDDLAAWAIAWNRDNTESGRREQE